MKAILFVSIIAIVGLSANAGAYPLPNKQAQRSLIIAVADGCWLGWHRNPAGGCSRDRYGFWGSGIDYKPGPFYPTPPNVCGGRGVYQVSAT